MPIASCAVDTLPAETAARGGARPSPRVLVIEDDEASAAHTRARLEESGWTVVTAQDGLEGLRLSRDGQFDAIIVDRMLPRLDGLSLVAELRAQNVRTPVLFVTAMGSVVDRVAGLEGGGDDYLVKPFSFEELRARLRIIIRRTSSETADATILSAGGLSLDRLTRAAARDGRVIDLLPLEFKLLEILLLHPGQVVTRSMLLEKVWGFKFDPRTNIVETHISRLRAKVDAESVERLITTVRGAGYMIAAA